MTIREIFELGRQIADMGRILADASIPVEEKIKAVIPTLKLAARLTPNLYDDGAVMILERAVNSDQFSDLVQLVIRLLNGEPLMYASGVPGELEQAASLAAEVIQAA